MIVGMIEGATRVCGRSQGYLGLPIRDSQVVDNASGATVNAMTSCWEPTEDELAWLIAGGKVYVTTFGIQPQPILVEAGPPAQIDADG